MCGDLILRFMYWWYLEVEPLVGDVIKRDRDCGVPMVALGALEEERPELGAGSISSCNAFCHVRM